MAKKFNIADFVSDAAAVSNVDHMEIVQIPLERICSNWHNFYGVEPQEEELAETIKISGLLTPLGVVRDGADDRFKLISGHRRWRALRYLRDSEPNGQTVWATVPCIVYATPEDADREQLMLIHANAQRVKSAPEVAREARETTEILTRMKERGVELPGRMRDRVAEALKISSTKLARLEAIEHNLAYPGWKKRWEENRLPEAVAYRLSQLSYDEQMKTADYVINKHVKDSDVTVAVVEEAVRHKSVSAPGMKDPLAYEADPVVVDRELVRRMDALGYFSGMHFANRKDGMEQLKTTFRNWGHGSKGLDWSGSSKGIQFAEPIEWLLGWGAMYDALAANALDDAIKARTCGAEKDPSAPLRSAQDDDADDEIYMAVGWKTGEPPAVGRYLAVIGSEKGQSTSEFSAQWNGEVWLVYDKPITSWMRVRAWWPLPAEYREDADDD